MRSFVRPWFLHRRHLVYQDCQVSIGGSIGSVSDSVPQFGFWETECKDRTGDAFD